MKATFRVIGQIVLVLLAAAVVIGALYLAVQNNVITAPVRGGSDGERFEPGGFEGRLAPPEGFEVRPEGGRPDFDEHGRGGASLGRGMAGVLGTLLKLTIVTLLVLGVKALVTKMRPAAAAA